MIDSGAIVGLWFGDELSAAGALPFTAYDKLITKFRSILGDEGKHGKLIYYANTAFSSLTEPTSGGPGANGSLIACTEGAWPPTGLCPAYWPHVPRGLTHVSLDNYVADCFWNALSTRGIYEQCERAHFSEAFRRLRYL